ncbi:MAG: hypothetical protein IT319_14275 [Anaerolineae bacterium]|nr:hypothetical protein [Anaerolineae bacterium]
MIQLITWRLWRALRYPDEFQPLYQRVQAQPVEYPGRRRLALLVRVIVFLMPFVVVAAPVVLLLASNALGAVVAFNVMSAIQRERDQHTYDLLGMTPIGLGRVNWLIAAACTYRLDAVDRVTSMRSLTIISASLIVFYFLFTGGFLAALAVVVLFAALHLDAIQSLVVGCLSGMLAQVIHQHGAPYAALAIFIFTQIILIYLPVTAVVIRLYNTLWHSLENDWLGVSLIAVIALALLFGLREVIIRLMWRTLERQLL